MTLLTDWLIWLFVDLMARTKSNPVVTCTVTTNIAYRFGWVFRRFVPFALWEDFIWVTTSTPHSSQWTHSTVQEEFGIWTTQIRMSTQYQQTYVRTYVRIPIELGTEKAFSKWGKFSHSPASKTSYLALEFRYSENCKTIERWEQPWTEFWFWSIAASCWKQDTS